MAAAADTSVCVFSSTQTGAPSLSNVAGNLIAVLDACLVNGWGLVTCDSVVIAGGVGTATINAGHAAIADGVVLFAGATGTLAAVNGRRKVKSITTTTVAFDAADLSDGTVAGTITLKVAPAGWAKAFSGTNLAAYKSANVQASGAYLSVDDTTTTYATVRGYETMSAVSSGAGPFPTADQVSAWWKAMSGSNSRWWVVANDRMMYIGVAPNSGAASATIIFGFGDLISRRAGDAYRAALFSIGSNSVGSPNQGHQSIAVGSAGAASRYIARSSLGIGAAVSISVTWLDAAAQSGSGYGGKVFPNRADNSIIITPMLILESGSYRAEMPGIYATPQDIQVSIGSDDRIFGLVGLSQRLVYKQWAYSASSFGGVFLDVSGPWGY